MQPWTEKWVEIRPISGGGQGDTLLVKSKSGDVEQAVLKLLKPQKAQDAKARGRMAQEVTNLKVLRNAGGKVPQVLDSNTEKFEDTNIPLYFVMDYVDGKTLADFVSASSGFSVAASIGIALELCSTMQIAIKQGIIHRDIKPENNLNQPTEIIDAIVTVHRYQADSIMPDGAVLIADMKKAIAKAVTIISRKVQGG